MLLQNIFLTLIFLFSPWIFLSQGNFNELKNMLIAYSIFLHPPHLIITSHLPSHTTSQTQATSTLAQVGSAVPPKIVPKKQAKPLAKAIITASTTPVSLSQLSPTVSPTPTEAPDFSAVNTASRLAVVNILCTTRGGELSPITGSGVIIDSRGIILTNAHIGQYWLLKNFYQPNFVQCTIRTGSPAYPHYHAELMYISPRWVENNLDLLKQTDPKGTGEHDYAFLHITDSIDGSLLPTSFAYIPPDTRDVSAGEPVVLVSYPAGFLGGQSILQNLDITSAVTTVQKLYTFTENTVDLISVGGTVVSQKGASGGAVVDGKTTLTGLISTESDAAQTSDRDLRAITLAHINRSLAEETQGNLQTLLDEDPAQVNQDFQSTALTLSKLLINSLSK